MRAQGGGVGWAVSFVMLAACNADSSGPAGPSGDDSASAHDSATSDDTGSADDTGVGDDTAADDTGSPIEWPKDARVLDHVRVVDASQIREDAAVIIVSDQIWDVMDAGQDWPPDATVIDESGRTVIPGLIDGHAHIFHSGSPWWVGDPLEANLQAQLSWGVVAIADMGGPPQIRALRDRVEEGTIAGPRIWATGRFLTAVGSHPCETFNDRQLCTYVDGDAARVVADHGDVDGYKVAVCDAAFTGWTTPRLDMGDLAQIVDAAGDRMVVAHIDEEDDASDALAAGVTVLAHPVFASDLSTSFDAWQHSTITAFAGTGDLMSGDLLADDLSYTPSAVVDGWTWLSNHPEAFVDGWIDGSADWAAHSRANVALAIADERPLVAGTDAGYWFVPHGVGLHRELQNLVDQGMTPQQAIAAATALPAQLYGWDDLGYVAAGYRADLVLLDGPPDEDIANTRAIHAVYLGGMPYESDTPWVAPGDGDFCLDDRDCDGDDTCDQVDHVCAPACDETYDRVGSCDEQSWCMPTDGLDTTTDGVCHQSDECDLYDQDCSPDYYDENCVPIDVDTNRCWKSGPQAAGQVCSWSDEDLYCQTGLFCSWVDYHCYELCDPDDPNACRGCTRQSVEGQPWFGLCP